MTTEVTSPEVQAVQPTKVHVASAPDTENDTYRLVCGGNSLEFKLIRAPQEDSREPTDDMSAGCNIFPSLFKPSSESKPAIEATENRDEPSEREEAPAEEMDLPKPLPITVNRRVCSMPASPIASLAQVKVNFFDPKAKAAASTFEVEKEAVESNSAENQVKDAKVKAADAGGKATDEEEVKSAAPDGQVASSPSLEQVMYESMLDVATKENISVSDTISTQMSKEQTLEEFTEIASEPDTSDPTKKTISARMSRLGRSSAAHVRSSSTRRTRQLSGLGKSFAKNVKARSKSAVRGSRKQSTQEDKSSETQPTADADGEKNDDEEVKPVEDKAIVDKEFVDEAKSVTEETAKEVKEDISADAISTQMSKKQTLEEFTEVASEPDTSDIPTKKTISARMSRLAKNAKARSKSVVCGSRKQSTQEDKSDETQPTADANGEKKEDEEVKPVEAEAVEDKEERTKEKVEDVKEDISADVAPQEEPKEEQSKSIPVEEPSTENTKEPDNEEEVLKDTDFTSEEIGKTVTTSSASTEFNSNVTTEKYPVAPSKMELADSETEELPTPDQTNKTASNASASKSDFPVSPVSYIVDLGESVLLTTEGDVSTKEDAPTPNDEKDKKSSRTSRIGRPPSINNIRSSSRMRARQLSGLGKKLTDKSKSAVANVRARSKSRVCGNKKEPQEDMKPDEENDIEAKNGSPAAENAKEIVEEKDASNGKPSLVCDTNIANETDEVTDDAPQSTHSITSPKAFLTQKIRSLKDWNADSSLALKLMSPRAKKEIENSTDDKDNIISDSTNGAATVSTLSSPPSPPPVKNGFMNRFSFSCITENFFCKTENVLGDFTMCRGDASNIMEGLMVETQVDDFVAAPEKQPTEEPTTNAVEVTPIFGEEHVPSFTVQSVGSSPSIEEIKPAETPTHAKQDEKQERNDQSLTKKQDEAVQEPKGKVSVEAGIRVYEGGTTDAVEEKAAYPKHSLEHYRKKPSLKRQMKKKVRHMKETTMQMNKVLQRKMVTASQPKMKAVMTNHVYSKDPTAANQLPRSAD